MNIIKVRAIVSSSLIISFIIESLTGIGLHLAPSGRIVNETNWHFLMWSKKQLEMLHTVVGFIMLALVIIHFIINYKMFLNEIKKLFKPKNI